MTLRTLNYGNYGIFLIMGHAGFCPSTVVYNCVMESSDGFQAALSKDWSVEAEEHPLHLIKLLPTSSVTQDGNREGPCFLKVVFLFLSSVVLVLSASFSMLMLSNRHGTLSSPVPPLRCILKPSRGISCYWHSGRTLKPLNSSRSNTL